MTENETEEQKLEREEGKDSLGVGLHAHISAEDTASPARISRGDARSSSLSSRLSTVIRRSLRLGPKRSTSAALESPVDIGKRDVGEHFFGETEIRSGNFFTKFADVKIEHFDKPYGSLAELKRLLQLNRVDSVKKFVRHNNWPVGHEIRLELWKELCRDRNSEANRQLYCKELEELVHRGKAKAPRLEFLSMDGVVKYDHGLREVGLLSLQRLLVVIERVRPDITFVPALYSLSAIFLHYLNEEDTFTCMMHLLRGGPIYLQQSFVAATASSRTLLALIKKHKSSVYHALKKYGDTADDKLLTKAVRNWRSWLFRYLPFDYVVRVVDCFLVEGHKMLLRVAVAIVYIWSKDKSHNISQYLGKTVDERIELLSAQLIDTASHCPVSVQTLLDAAVGIRNLKGSTIARYQKSFEDEVREEEIQRAQEAVVSLPSPTKKPANYLYTSPFISKIVGPDVAADIMCSLPYRLQLETPKLLFRMSDDGSSFTKLWTNIDAAEQTLLIIEAVKGDIFGAYCSASWSERHDRRERARSRYFGTGESFVWKLNKELQKTCIYGWAGNEAEHPDSCPQMFMAADEKSLIIGSGGGDAIAIREELFRGISSASDTFGSPALVKDREFVIRELEVFEVPSGSS